MTSAKSQDRVAASHGIGTDATRWGKWAFIPGSTEHSPGADAVLQYEDQRINLTYSSTVLGEFLRVMGQIQGDFHRRMPWSAQLPSTAHGVE